MAITRIPEGYRRGFARIKTLSSSEISSLASALDSQSPKGTKTAALAVVQALPYVNKSDAEGIVRSLSSLYVYMAGDADLSIPELISDLINAMQAIGSELDITAEEAGAFREKMTQLLSLKQFRITSKIDRLKNDFLSTFEDLKTLTDLRPVFDSAKAKPVGLAITHTLKLIYHEAGDHKELYFAIGPKGLARIKTAIERAEEKSESLKLLMADAQLNDLSE